MIINQLVKQSHMMKEMGGCILVTLFASLIMVSGGHASFINALSCSQANVQTAINSASDGDTVLVPPGNCTWTTTVETNNKKIALQGAGQSQTVITVNTTYEGLSINNNAGKTITIKGFKWLGIAGNEGLIQVYGTVKDFRITDCYFDWQGGDGAIVINGYANGLIDHSIFAPTNTEIYRSAIRIYSDGTTDAYARESALGTGNSVYVEDCTFAQPSPIGYTHAVWAQFGGSYVFRHNTVRNFDLDVHGHCSAGGAREFEIYDNEFTASGNYGTATIVIRGGTGVIYNNTFTSNSNVMWGAGMRMQEIDDGGICNPTVGGGPCHACSYPAIHQIGRGKNDVLDPLYNWNNKLDGSIFNIDIIFDASNSSCSCNPVLYVHDFLVSGRDYYNSGPKPGYTAYTYPHPLVTKGNRPAEPGNIRIVN